MIPHLAGGAAASLVIALPWFPLLGDEGGSKRQLQGNLPPVVCFGPDCQPTGWTKILQCEGDETTYLLDASGSYDPEGEPLSFLWESCPQSTVDDPLSPVTTLRIDTSGGCSTTCGVRVAVSDGKLTFVGRIFIQVIEDIPICGDKPHKIEMVYTGESCAATNHDQDPDAVYCDGSPLGLSPVHVLVTMLHQEDRVYFDGLVELGESFEIDGEGQPSGKVPPNSHVRIFDPVDGTLLQESWFHTSCSQPLSIGDQFGAVILTGFTP